MKIEAYNLIEYAAVANLDADMIFMRNADELFLLPPGSHADGKVSVFNAGMFVIRPSLKIKNDLFNVFSKRCGAFKVFLLSKVVFFFSFFVCEPDVFGLTSFFFLSCVFWIRIFSRINNLIIQTRTTLLQNKRSYANAEKRSISRSKSFSHVNKVHNSSFSFRERVFWKEYEKARRTA